MTAGSLAGKALADRTVPDPTTVLFPFAAAAFGFPLTAGTRRLPLMAALWATCVTACGLVLGVHAHSQGQLAAASDIGALTITCLSGCLVPLTVLPHWVSTVAPATPGYGALHGFQAAVTGNTAAYAHATAVITAITATAPLVSARAIRH
ncbi:hypothetical protein ACFWOB_44335 [Streptomyces sp. NPDC058420]|uniref:hypothetical protein n=1 Tax=Streptomyces sp. NPDC058420 TaxID=3346489 RepID=UPI00365409E5